MNFTAYPRFSNGPDEFRPTLRFRLFGQKPPSTVSFDGGNYNVRLHGSNHGKVNEVKTRGDISGLPFADGAKKGQIFEFHITPTGRLVFDSKRAATRQQRRAAKRAAAKASKKAFVASVSALQEIINAPKGRRTGKRGLFTGKRKKQSRNEKKLQKAARKYVESLGRGIIVVQWDYQGNPDHLYLIPRKNLWLAVVVEFKDLGKKPEKHQAKKILGLMDRMPVQVISEIETFKKWFNRVSA